MPDRGDRSPSSDSGFIGVGTVIALAIVGLGIYLLLAAFEGDPAHYGSVPVPSGQAPIELDAGDVNVSYAEDVDPDALVVPETVTFVVRTAEGEVLESDDSNGSAQELDAGAAELIGSVDVPDDGTYYVSAESSGSPTNAQPELAFGLSPMGAVRVRFEEVVDELKGPTGIVVLVALGLLFLIPRVQHATKERKRRRERPDIYH